MRRYRVLLSLLLGLRPRARHPSACVSLGDHSGLAQINLVLKTVSYYPQTEEWREPPGWWSLSEGTSCVFRSTLQGFWINRLSASHRHLRLLTRLAMISLYDGTLWRLLLWLIVCTTFVAIVAYLVMVASTRTWDKVLKVRIHYLATFWQTNPLAKSHAWLEVKSIF
jgi:hypothetical protein